MAAKQPRKTMGSKQAKAEEIGLSLTLDGRTYTVRHSDLTSYHVYLLRKETGYSFLSLMQAVGEKFDIDLLGIIIWLARLRDGENVTLRTVLEGIDYDGLDEVLESMGEPQEDEPGEA